MTGATRPAAISGLFYERDGQKLHAQITQLLAAVGEPTGPNKPRAIITPHAGLIYSGATAAAAWKSASTRSHVQRVLLLGPAHRVAVNGVATSSAESWQTPLGPIQIDSATNDLLQRLPFVRDSDLAHIQEHCLEVQVPFIQILFPQAKLVPLVVGDASPQQVAEILGNFWDDDTTLIAISSDLSHFHNYPLAQQLDRATAQAIETLDWQHIGPEQACGCRAVNGLLWLLSQENCQIRTLALCNSGDTAGDRDRVVGYGAFVAH